MAINRGTNIEARRLAFKWLRHVKRIKVLVGAAPMRHDLITAAFEREERSFAALHNFRNCLRYEA